MMVNDNLIDKGIRSADLHGDVSQNKREFTLQKFRSGKLKAIVVNL